MPDNDKFVFDLEHTSKLFNKAAVFLPVITALAYLCSYWFEVGFLSFYKIPLNFAQIKPENFAILFLSLSYLALAINSLISDFRKDRTGKRKIIDMSVYFVIGFSFYTLLLVALPFDIFLAITIVTVVGMLLYFLPRKITNKIVKHPHPRRPPYHPAVKIGVSVIGFIWLLCAISYFLGGVWSRFQAQYTVFYLNKEKYIIVETYSSKYIVSRLDDNETTSYKLITTDYLQKFELHNESLRINKFDLSDKLKDSF